MGWAVGVDFLDYRLWDRRAAGSQRTILEPRSGVASAACTFRDDLYFIRDSILLSLFVCVRSRDLSMRWVGVDSLDTCAWYWRCGSVRVSKLMAFAGV